MHLMKEPVLSLKEKTNTNFSTFKLPVITKNLS